MVRSVLDLLLVFAFLLAGAFILFMIAVAFFLVAVKCFGFVV
jgi:hypothetical protein